ncbi:MAG: hypothetical protein ACLU9S_03625 [Oscillospiraceae bacterium]
MSRLTFFPRGAGHHDHGELHGDNGAVGSVRKAVEGSACAGGMCAARREADRCSRDRQRIACRVDSTINHERKNATGTIIISMVKDDPHLIAWLKNNEEERKSTIPS